MKTRRIILIFLFLLFIVFTEVFSQYSYGDIAVNGTIHRSDEIGRIIETSSLNYVIVPVDSSYPFTAPDYPLLRHDLFCTGTDSNRTLQTYTLSDEAQKLLDSAEGYLKNNELDSTLVRYQACLKIEPQYKMLYTLIGDVFFIMKKYDSAGYYFQLSLDSNFFDYTTHWFYADYLAETGELSKGLEQITIAHILNRNHPDIYLKLLSLRKRSGKDWDEWYFEPQYDLGKEGNQVFIYFDPIAGGNLGYILVKAIWQYEPAYKQRMLGAAYFKDAVTSLEEEEALFTNLPSMDTNTVFMSLLDEGYLPEFVIYEILSRKYPYMIYTLSDSTFVRVIEYVNKYH